ncbi:uncharacterized protein LAESUDRAFT_744920 [Laetiporus sulphureus 93-53]|uniref:Uncharacterized protein n=1 Tax=Laetiporus sulphureus 93-53 TaxID=1314785 RepID=A0A165CFS1_9APHY|nr:uncharacterized protein LAESUDRAFT_744920 [Laetiporus sulphureus 93-53]KZT02731.1 hypothetical protein LAESUDRAFT_744920 [Laetiporus sulphureus 93-53]
MSTSSRWFCALLLILCLALSTHAILGQKWEATELCKCICFGSNYTILHMEIPDNPKQPCLSCTKQWCLNQNLPICAGATLGDADPDTATGKEGDVEARCFQRDSPRDQLVVTIFLLTVFGLLLGAGIKGRMIKAGLDTSLPWHTSRRWWEAWIPQRHPEDIGFELANRVRGLWNRGQDDRRDQYISVSVTPTL